MKKTTLVIIALLFVSYVAAQRPMNRPSGRRPIQRGVVGMVNAMPANNAPMQQERMEMIMVWKLTEDLKLTPEQADKFFPRMRAHRENLENIDTELKEAAKDIRRKVEDDKEISDSEFNKMFERTIDLERQKIDEKTRFMSELNGILDNIQRVKLTMFKHKFARDMQEQIRAKRKAMAR